MQRGWNNFIFILLRTQATNFVSSRRNLFSYKPSYIRFLSVYYSHIIKLCKLYFLARSNCTNIFHALNSTFLTLKWVMLTVNIEIKSSLSNYYPDNAQIKIFILKIMLEFYSCNLVWLIVWHRIRIIPFAARKDDNTTGRVINHTFSNTIIELHFHSSISLYMLLHIAPSIDFILFCILHNSKICKFEWAGFTQTCLVQLLNVF